MQRPDGLTQLLLANHEQGVDFWMVCLFIGYSTDSFHISLPKSTVHHHQHSVHVSSQQPERVAVVFGGFLFLFLIITSSLVKNSDELESLYNTLCNLWYNIDFISCSGFYLIQWLLTTFFYRTQIVCSSECRIVLIVAGLGLKSTLCWVSMLADRGDLDQGHVAVAGLPVSFC